MAGLTKEQRAQKAAEIAAGPAASEELVRMVTTDPAFPGAPTEADVHQDEVERWIAHGWRVESQ